LKKNAPTADTFFLLILLFVPVVEKNIILNIKLLSMSNKTRKDLNFILAEKIKTFSPVKLFFKIIARKIII
jgi:hypothetical protein